MKELWSKTPDWARLLIFLALLGGFPVGSSLVGDFSYRINLSRCNNGNNEACEKIPDWNTKNGVITNEDYIAEKAAKAKAKKIELAKSKATKRANDCIAASGLSSECLLFNTELLDADLLSRVKPFIAKQQIIAKEKAAAEAKFKAEGWVEQKPGIFVKWCKNASFSYPKKGDCPYTDTYMDSVWRMMVWCKERSCGNIYAKINILQGSGGPVVGWTNDTAYGDYGQKVVLTFQTSSNGNRARLVEFTTY